jgi:hypothetical protein
MRKMERLRQSGCITCIERREMPIEHPYRSGNRIWMIESRCLHLLLADGSERDLGYS